MNTFPQLWDRLPTFRMNRLSTKWSLFCKTDLQDENLLKLWSSLPISKMKSLTKLWIEKLPKLLSLPTLWLLLQKSPTN